MPSKRRDPHPCWDPTERGPTLPEVEEGRMPTTGAMRIGVVDRGIGMMIGAETMIDVIAKTIATVLPIEGMIVVGMIETAAGMTTMSTIGMTATGMIAIETIAIETIVTGMIATGMIATDLADDLKTAALFAARGSSSGYIRINRNRDRTGYI